VHASLLNVVASALPAASTGTTGSSSGGGGSFAPLLFMVVLFFAAYLLFIRPARNRQRAAMDERRKVSVGDEIITTSGLIATVVEVGDDALTLEIAPGVRARFVPAAILRVLTDEPEPEADVTNHEVIDPDESGDNKDGST
jgi:preprotein translocase subunit YajC